MVDALPKAFAEVEAIIPKLYDLTESLFVANWLWSLGIEKAVDGFEDRSLTWDAYQKEFIDVLQSCGLFRNVSVDSAEATFHAMHGSTPQMSSEVPKLKPMTLPMLAFCIQLMSEGQVDPLCKSAIANRMSDDKVKEALDAVQTWYKEKDNCRSPLGLWLAASLGQVHRGDVFARILPNRDVASNERVVLRRLLCHPMKETPLGVLTIWNEREDGSETEAEGGISTVPLLHLNPRFSAAETEATADAALWTLLREPSLVTEACTNISHTLPDNERESYKTIPLVFKPESAKYDATVAKKYVDITKMKEEKRAIKFYEVLLAEAAIRDSGRASPTPTIMSKALSTDNGYVESDKDSDKANNCWLLIRYVIEDELQRLRERGENANVQELGKFWGKTANREKLTTENGGNWSCTDRGGNGGGKYYWWRWIKPCNADLRSHVEQVLEKMKEKAEARSTWVKNKDGDKKKPAK